MALMDSILAKAKAQKMHIVLPEGTEPRTIEGATIITKEGIAKVTLIGDPEEIKKVAAGKDLTGIDMIDPVKADNFEDYAATFCKMRKKKGISIEQARETMKDPLFYATMMVYKDEADGMVAGAINSTGNTIRPALQIIKTKPGIPTVSGSFLNVFYPVSVSGIVKKWNKFGKKHCGKYLTKLGISALCLFPVWICNGLWHGARWSYIFYGMYYFVILLAEVAVEPLRDNILEICHLDKNALPYRILQTLKTWLIIFTGELFFRANGLQAGMSMFFSIFKGNNIQSFENIVARQEEIRGILMSVGLDRLDYFVVIAGCIVVAVVGIIKEKKLLGEEGIQKLWLPVRWTLYYALIFAVLILGAYGMGYQQVDMIYAGF